VERFDAWRTPDSARKFGTDPSSSRTSGPFYGHANASAVIHDSALPQ